MDETTNGRMNKHSPNSHNAWRSKVVQLLLLSSAITQIVKLSPVGREAKNFKYVSPFIVLEKVKACLNAANLSRIQSMCDQS